jgi:hypothetical protein
VIVDPERARLVQWAFEAYAAGEKQRVHPHYLKSTVYRAHCGGRLCLTNAKGPYLDFFCVGRRQRRTNCQQRHLAAEAVERAVEDSYGTVRLPEGRPGHHPRRPPS